jgi:hypothetical protein
MKNLLKQLFCKHEYKTYWSSGNDKLYVFQPFYDAWEVKKCNKCGKVTEL